MTIVSTVESAVPLDTTIALRSWARGLFGLEAAVEVLLRAMGGRFADPGWPWIRFDGYRLWLDPDRFHPTAATLPRREAALLAIVDALASGHPIRHLADLLAEFDRDTLVLVLAAFAHAGGSHTHTRLDTGTDGSRHLSLLGPIIDWTTP
jgi:hypothetical protein